MRRKVSVVLAARIRYSLCAYYNVIKASGWRQNEKVNKNKNPGPFNKYARRVKPSVTAARQPYNNIVVTSLPLLCSRNKTIKWKTHCVEYFKQVKEVLFLKGYKLS